MPYKTPAIVFGFAASALLAAAAFAQNTQAPSMPADLARMAESRKRAWRNRRSRDICPNTPIPAI